MFGKKLLSVVGLLFLGSQIISVEAAGAGCTLTLNAGVCTPAGCDENDAGNLYLVKDLNDKQDYIVKIGTNGLSCDVEEGAGNYCKTRSGSVKTTIDAFCSADDIDTWYTCGSDGKCTEDGVPNSCKRASCKLEAGVFVGCSKGDYLVVDETEETIKLLEDTTSQYGGKLYQCDGSNCSKVIDTVGYYKNAGSIELSYIKCNGKGCVPVKPISDGDCSSTKKVEDEDGNEVIIKENGELVSIENKVYICLDANVKLSLEGVTGDKYFMNMDVPVGNVFGGDGEVVGYAVVDVKETEIHIVEEQGLGPNGENVKMYQYTDSNYKIYEKDSGVCETMRKTIIEFKLDTCSASPDVAYYSKGQTKSL